MRKSFFCIIFMLVALSFIFSSTVTAGDKEEASAAFGDASNLYYFCNYAGAKAYDVYNFTLGEQYWKQAKKALKKEKKYEKAKNFSQMAIPHLKIVQQKYTESES
jgi:hypothetical protein